MTEQEFAELLALGHEVGGVEFKAAGPRTDRPLFQRVVRAVLGMANRRDGGRVIIGVGETGNMLDPIGLNNPDLESWNYDDVAAGLSVYADPSVSFDLERVAYQGKTFVVLRVREFEEIPILCKADYTPATGAILRAGACYVRSRRKPETSEIPTHEDMRALIELATDKAVQRWIAQNQRAGIVTLGITTPPSEQERFDTQLGDLR